VALAQDDPLLAQAHFAESLAVARESGDQQRIAEALVGMAGCAAAQGQPLRALRLAGAGAALRARDGHPLSADEQEALTSRLAPAREALPDDAQAAAWAEGQALSLEEAIAYALEGLGDG
jgi:hypothetical protein